MSKPNKAESKVLKRFHTYAQELLGCTHEMCSMSEATYEELYGKRIMNILEGNEPDHNLIEDES